MNNLRLLKVIIKSVLDLLKEFYKALYMLNNNKLGGK